MQEAGVDSVRLPLYWSSIQPQSPWWRIRTGTASTMRSGWPPKRASGSCPSSPPRRNGWRRSRWCCRWTAPGSAGPGRPSCAKRCERYGPEGSFWEENPDLPFLPIHRWEIWNEENIVSFAERPDPVGFATLIRISGRVLHEADPDSQVILGGLFGRPLQIPPNVASGDYLSRVYRARRVKRYFDGVALHPYVARAKAMGAQIDQPAADHARPPRQRHADLRDRARLGLRQRPDPLAARPPGPGATSSTRPSRCSPPTGCAGRSAASGGSPGPTKAAAASFCHSAGLLTENREAKPAWYRFNAWTGGDPETVPRASSARPARNSKSTTNRKWSAAARRPRAVAR